MKRRFAPSVTAILSVPFLAVGLCSAQQLAITPDHPDGTYAVGDTVHWTFQWKDATTPPPSAAHYVLKSGGMKAVGRGEISFENGVAKLDTHFDAPGTILVEATWDPVDPKSRATAGAVAAPDKITPAAPPPDDFDSFWKAKLDELAQVPPNPRLEPADAGKADITYHMITLDNIRGTHINGQIARPAAGDKFPALLILQWAGVYPLQKSWVTDRAADGWLALNILPHDLPIDQPDSFYKDQYAGPLKNYWALGNDDPDKSYYLRMYLSCYRAVEYLKSRPDWDGKALVVMGTSQGGQQTLAVAGLHPDSITAALPFLPAACDMLAPSIGRAAGFPNWYAQTYGGRNPQKVRDASRYYDPINFARHIKCPVLIGTGLHDDLAPPSSVLAAANVITAPKEVIILPTAGHQDEHGSQSTYNQRAYGAWLPALRQGKPAPLPSTTSSTPGPGEQPAARNDDPVWAQKHAELVARAKQGDIGLYFLGDSITRRWEATHRENWHHNFAGWKAADFGAGGDKTQHVLYRLQHGELDGVNPKVVVLLIGTNNIGFDPIPPDKQDALVADTARGIAACVNEIRHRAPNAKILLTAITPRNTNGTTSLMPIINRINAQIAPLADGTHVRFLNINDKLADPTGKLLPGMTEDGLHLSNQGYQIWADAMSSILTQWLGPRPTTQPAPSALNAEQEHRRMLALLKIDNLRRGPDGNPNSPFAANSDESRATPYPNLPDPLVLNDGQPVTTPDTWWTRRRPELVELFDREIYGRVPSAVPPVKWETTATTKELRGDIPVITKQLLGHVDNSACPSTHVDIRLTLTTPASASRPVPVVMEFTFAPLRGTTRRATATTQSTSGPLALQQLVLSHGWAVATLVPTSIQADNGAGLTQGIIGLANHGRSRNPDDWGALRAWAWGASRALDYFETDPAVDSKRVAIEGLSRYGKAALVTMAYDRRFAVAFVASSGAGGAKLLRRNFGEQVENLASPAEFHWFAGNFLKYAGPLTPGDLPVDAHELIALCAPRPVFISAGSPAVEGNWVDARGTFLAAVAAGPVYRLLGHRDLGTTTYPPIETPLTTGDLAFRQHTGGHTAGPNWPTFIEFARRYLDSPALPHATAP